MEYGVYGDRIMTLGSSIFYLLKGIIFHDSDGLSPGAKQVLCGRTAAFVVLVLGLRRSGKRLMR